MAYGTGIYGITFFGNATTPAIPVVREIGDFQFTVTPKTEGYSIRVDWHVPDPTDAPEWTRRLRILRKRGEWPQSWDDSGAVVLVDVLYPAIEDDYYLEQTGMESGVIYYYALFQERVDGAWINDIDANRGSAYAFARWGFVDYMFNTLPRGYRSEDANTGHLYQFLSVIGALFDNMKTDVEHLLTLMEIDNIHDDLIFMIDKKLGWPTWNAAGGLQRRNETAAAVDLYKLLGRADAYEQMLEEISDWEATIVEGWKYVFFSNDRFESKTPDTTDPDTRRLIGRVDDILKYTPDTEGWHSVSGLGFFLEEIPGISDGISASMLDRTRELIEWAKASYVMWGLTLLPMTEEYFSSNMILEEEYLILSPVIEPLIEELGWETSSWSLFTSNDTGSTSTTIDDRTFHTDITYS